MKRKFLIVLLLLIAAYVAVVFYNQYKIIHPNKRELKAYHYSWLKHSKEHSLKLIRLKGHADIIIAKYDPNAKQSTRSAKVRKELFALGYTKEQLQERGTIIMFHGKNGRKEDLLPVAERYVSAGFTCVLADLPAHGSSPKVNCDYGRDKGFYNQIINAIKDKVDIENRPIILWGMSLGGRYAIASALNSKEGYKPKKLILVSTFDKLSNVLKDKSADIFGDFLGSILYKSLRFSLLKFSKFDPENIDSAKDAKSINIPIFMLHGKRDKLISYKYGKNLFNSFSSKDKEFHLDKNGDHHNILVTNYPFYLKSIDFVLKDLR